MKSKVALIFKMLNFVFNIFLRYSQFFSSFLFFYQDGYVSYLYGHQVELHADIEVELFASHLQAVLFGKGHPVTNLKRMDLHRQLVVPEIK